MGKINNDYIKLFYAEKKSFALDAVLVIYFLMIVIIVSGLCHYYYFHKKKLEIIHTS